MDNSLRNTILVIYINIYIALVFHQVCIEAEKFSLLLGFAGGSAVKNLPANEETGSIPRWGRFPGVGNGSSLQYSFLENSMDRGA